MMFVILISLVFIGCGVFNRSYVKIDEMPQKMIVVDEDGICRQSEVLKDRVVITSLGKCNPYTNEQIE